MLQGYANHIPEHVRVARFIAGEPRLAWAFPILSSFKNSDIMLVGGSARDAVLGREPRGLHVVASGLPKETLRKALARQGKLTPHEHGFHFEPAGHTGGIDISLPRTDIYHPRAKQLLTKSHPAGNHSHDSAWRDFTVNGLRYSLRDGQLVDPWNGLQHLENGQLVAIGEASRRFEHRPLHALRTIRLASNLGFTPAADSWDAAREHLPNLHRTHHTDSGHVYAVPRAHIGQELMRLLDLNASQGLALMNKADQSGHVFGSLLNNSSAKALSFAEKALRNSRLGLSLLTIAYPHESEGATRLSDFARRYHIETDSPEWQHAAAALRASELLKQDPTKTPRALSAKLLKGTPGELAIASARGWAEAIGDHQQLARLHAWDRQRTKLASMNEPLLRGRDLIAQGFRPGPHLRQLMHDLLDAQLDGRVITTADARAFVRSH